MMLLIEAAEERGRDADFVCVEEKRVGVSRGEGKGLRQQSCNGAFSSESSPPSPSFSNTQSLDTYAPGLVRWDRPADEDRVDGAGVKRMCV